MPRRMFRADELLGVRVLLVDDNAVAREILASMAMNFGLDVDVAWDGQQALRMIAEAGKKAQPYALVLMDWKMPAMDGIETVQRLQSAQLDKTPAVIMFTAYGREGALDSAEQRGVMLKSVLTKPVSSSTLLEAIGEALGKGSLAETRSSAKASNNAATMAALHGARILLVEDNEMNQELAMELLGQAGIEVVIANNGQEAVDVLAQDAAFDGVLMDCQMPVMDGYTATREIRKRLQFEKLPIIAMTANAMASDRKKVIEAGMWDHIAKPLDVGEMFNTIAKWIKPGKVGAGGTAQPPWPATGMTPGKAVPEFPTLPGIDVKAGLATTMNNASLYTRMLVKFREGQCNFAGLFATARQSGDPTAPTRCAHTLKGTAGNIGANGIQAAAAALEQACLQNETADRIDDLLAKTLDELAPVMDGLQKVGASSGTVETAANVVTGELPKDFDAGKFTERLARLKALLEDSDAEAGDIVEEILEDAAGTPLAPALQRVARAAAEFDFDAALQALNEIG
jgi:CheY-like chemotaxis protein